MRCSDRGLSVFIVAFFVGFAVWGAYEFIKFVAGLF